MLLTTEQSLTPFLIIWNNKTELRRVIIVVWQDSSEGKCVIFKKEEK